MIPSLYSNLSSLRIDNLYFAEAESKCFTHGSQAALNDCSPALLQTAAVDGEHPQSGCDMPDVEEGHAGKITSPT